ncbi:MAG: phosphate-starvation-inducible PsiE family protein [Agarilytica sp.]
MPYLRDMGHKGLIWAQDIGLIIVAIATLFAIGQEVAVMIGAKKVALADLLLMFIYLEVLAMVAIYLESGKLPVRMPLYIAIVALARYMILDMKNLDTTRLLGIAASTLIFAITIFIIRYGHIRFPYGQKKTES